MNIKILSLAFICLVFSFCTSPPQQKIWVTGSIQDFSLAESRVRTKGSILIEDRSFDEVWDTCEKVLIRSGYLFYKSDKTTGEFLVRSSRATANAEEYQILLISLSQSAGKISVTCVVWARGVEEKDASPAERKEMNRFLETLQKDLKK